MLKKEINNLQERNHLQHSKLTRTQTQLKGMENRQNELKLLKTEMTSLQTAYRQRQSEIHNAREQLRKTQREIANYVKEPLLVKQESQICQEDIDTKGTDDALQGDIEIVVRETSAVRKDLESIIQELWGEHRKDHTDLKREEITMGETLEETT